MGSDNDWKGRALRIAIGIVLTIVLLVESAGATTVTDPLSPNGKTIYAYYTVENAVLTGSTTGYLTTDNPNNYFSVSSYTYTVSVR